MAKFFRKYTLHAGVIALLGWVFFGGTGAWALPAERAFARDTVRGPQDSVRHKKPGDTLPEIGTSPPPDARTLQQALDRQRKLQDSIRRVVDSAALTPPKPLPDTARRVPKKSFLDDVISGKNKDSLVYEPKKKMVHIYEKGDVTYQKMTLKADYIQVDMETRNIHAYGRMDSIPETGEKKPTRPEFNDGGHPYSMDTITYNLKSGKAKIKGVSTQEGEGFLIGQEIKKMPNNTINIANGKYTTCDHIDHPHFYLAMTKAKAIPGKKVIVGPSYLVFEDVPIYFLGVPFGFFPMINGPTSGFIMPQYGEEQQRGFFLRNGGYYFAINDYVDATLTAGIYSLGSWEAGATSHYIKRYKFSGSLNAQYTKTVYGEKQDTANYVNQSNYSIAWTHSQDPKFRPNSQLQASVNFRSSGYNKYGAQTSQEMLNTETNSSITYTQRWNNSPVSLSASFSHSQNSQNKTVSLSMPNVVLNVSKIYPFRRKEAMGKQRWYEKIGLTYTGNLTNSFSGNEKDLFSEAMVRQMRNNVDHSIPISASFNVLKYINLSPSANYKEKWFFRSVEQTWDPAANAIQRDTTYGFYRVWDYNVAASTSTKVYGMFQFGPKFPLQAIRHVMTPSASLSFAPDFSSPKYGYYKPVQTDATGAISTYSPYEYAPPKGQSASLSFSLSNTLEMKVKSKQDTTGVKKIKLIENLSASSSYNFLADSLNLSPFSLNLRTANLFGNFAINLSATLDPYMLDEKGNKINKLAWGNGGLGRITTTGWSFSYTFQNSKKSGAMNDISHTPAAMPEDAAFFDKARIDPALQRQMMSSRYYDFNIPWNFGFNYSLTYSKPGIVAAVNQSLGFNGSVTLTPKMGVTVQGGYDLEHNKLSNLTMNFTRDLHCWQMSFSWSPLGFRQYWTFNIGVKASMLKDLKYDKSSSFYNLTD